MRKTNPKCSNKDLFKYSILILLHHQNISNHPERISNLKPYELMSLSIITEPYH